jgi:flagellar biosynthesis GTPase FlhF
MILYLLMSLTLVNLPGPFDNITKISTVNQLKEEARAAYLDQDYEKAIGHYRVLLDSFRVNDEQMLLNLSNAYYKNQDFDNARLFYDQLTDSRDYAIRSRAYQQLGVLAHQEKKYEEALNSFKASLKAEPANEEARYNYELLKKLMKEQEQQQQQQQNQDKDQQQKDQQEQQEKEQQEKEQQEQQEKGEQEENQEQQEEEQQQDQQEQAKDQQDQQQQNEQQQQESQEKQDEQKMDPSQNRFEEVNISEEKAKMILEAMRNSEIQYIQQNKRRPKQNPDRSKPDW